MQKFLNFVLVFFIVYFGMQLLFPREVPEATQTGELAVSASSGYTVGKPVVLTLTNQTGQELVLKDECPAEPFRVLQYVAGKYEVLEAVTEDVCVFPESIPAGQSATLSYAPWQETLFVQPGKYRVEVPVTLEGEEHQFLTDFEIVQPGVFGTFWREVFYRPLFNILIFFSQNVDHSFGWGVVLLTLLIRVILLVPFQRSLVAQRKLQQIQPELDRIKKQHANNQQMQAMETMALFKKHKVNPLSSCLPILIQMPFLLAVFWIVQSGLAANNSVLLYSFLNDVNFHLIETGFYGLDLLGVALRDKGVLLIGLALLVGALQYVQMRMSMARATRKQEVHLKEDAQSPAAMAQDMTKIFVYVLPVMIVFFAATLPAAVGLYWLTSTAFGIGQQLVVNRQLKVKN